MSTKGREFMSSRKFFAVLIAAVLLWVGFRWLLPVVMPFLLAALLALAAEPLVRFFHKKTKLPRAVAAGIGVTMTLVLLALILMVLVALAIKELNSLASVVPDLEDTAVQGISLLEQWLLGLVQRAPQSISPILTHSVEGIFSDSTAFLDKVSTRLLGLASGVVSKLPDGALGLFTWLLASFMISARLPGIREWIKKKLPSSWHEKAMPMLKKMKASVLGWIKAQSKLMGVTALVLTAGFFILQVPYAPVWAVLIALIDALPVLGTGMVLVPWSIVCFLQGDSARGIGLLGIYAVAALLRSVLEPRLVGKQLGLDPLITLLAIYAGYRLFGFGGMILAPLLAVILTQVFSLPKEQ